MTKFSTWIGGAVLAVLLALTLAPSAGADDYVPPAVPSTSVVVQSTSKSSEECTTALGSSSERALAGAADTCAATTTAPTQVIVQGTNRGGDLASTGVGSNVTVLAVVGVGVLLIGGLLTFFGARMIRRPKLH